MEKELLDLHSLNELREVMGDALDDLFLSFQQQAAETIQQLISYSGRLDSSQQTQIQQLAHKLKGSALNLYCSRVVKCCEEVEQVAVLDQTQFLQSVDLLTTAVEQSGNAYMQWTHSLEH